LDLKTLKIPPKEGITAQICLMHTYAGPVAGKVFKERLYGYNELAELSPDIFVLGHYHLDQGIQKVDGKFFVNLGSISRGTLTDESLDHKPKFGFIRITAEKGSVPTIVVDSIPLTIKPAEEVFDVKKRDDEKKEGLEIQKYVEHLVAEATAADTKKLTFEDHMKGMNLEKEVYDMVLELIQEASVK
jgi:hypothetical protein